MISEYMAEHLNDLKKVATALRVLGMDAVLQAKSGHVGVPLGCAEMITALYFGVMKHSPKNPLWLDRDRFVLSNGHGSMLQYAVLHMSGYGIQLDDIKKFRQLDSRTPGHPEVHHTPGIECTTGPLGQGIANAVGMAIAERMLAARFNDTQHTVFDHRTYVMLGDGCLMEGVSAEACSMAGHLKLNRLIALYDDNHITIDGKTDISFSENVEQRFLSQNWNVLHADAHDFMSLGRALDHALEESNKPNGEGKPTLIICRGVPGKGSPKWEGNPKIHGNPMSAEDVIEAKKHLGLENTTPFHVPAECGEAACRLLSRTNNLEAKWLEQLQNTQRAWKKQQAPQDHLWYRCFAEDKAPSLSASIWKKAEGSLATRTVTGTVLSEMHALEPRLVGGSADLAGSTLTTIKDSSFIHAKDFSGKNIHFGVREHAMGSLCNGLALHGPFHPYCATFAVFSDYMRPAIRLAAIQNLPVTFIFTHDSIGVGEDGPTHQPIEHASALRAIPGLSVFRPADGYETCAAWEKAIQSKNRPVTLLLTRQNVADLGEHARRSPEVLSKNLDMGAYLIQDFPSAEDKQSRSVILCASGSEVGLISQVASELNKMEAQSLVGEKKKVRVRVISCPAPQELVKHPTHFHQLFPENITTIAVEAGTPWGWGEIVGRNGAIVGISEFGRSAPAEKIFSHFGFTVSSLTEKVLSILGLRK